MNWTPSAWAACRVLTSRCQVLSISENYETPQRHYALEVTAKMADRALPIAGSSRVPRM